MGQFRTSRAEGTAIRRQTRPQTPSRSSALETSLAWLARLARFDYTAFDEIRAEPQATTAAVIVVAVTSVLAGVGSWLWAVFSRDVVGISGTEVFVRSLLIGSILQTLAFFLWVGAVDWFLRHLYHASSTYLELLRVMGFAFFPVALSVFVAIGALAVPVGIFAFAVTILLSSIAVQSATDADAPSAMMATLFGFGLFLIVMGVCANVMEVRGLGGMAPGILFFALDL